MKYVKLWENFESDFESNENLKKLGTVRFDFNSLVEYDDDLFFKLTQEQLGITDSYDLEFRVVGHEGNTLIVDVYSQDEFYK
jgi:hypothetical protein